MTYTLLSVFSGIGGLDLAAHWAGFETVEFIEREPFCQKVLEKHWSGVPIHSDVFEYHSTEHVDVVCGGFPCQPFSVAGNRKGADDERYLLPEMLRIIREVKPYAVLFENVPGFPSLDDGFHFKYLLRTLAEMGFDAEWGHLRASDSGAPHTRERWFCVAYADSIGRGQGRDHWQERQLLHDINGDAAQGEPERKRRQRGVGAVSENAKVAESQRVGREARRGFQRGYAQAEIVRNGEPERSSTVVDDSQSRNSGNDRADKRTPVRAQHPFAGSSLRSRTRSIRRSTAGGTQSRLCGTPDGLSGGMDFVGWPARPGEDQYSYEPPRVVSEKIPDRAARLKALGNAVVPQVVYPLFLSIHEWLTEIKEAQQ